MKQSVDFDFNPRQLPGLLATQASYGHIGMVRLLIEQGADPEDSRQNLKALFVAARRGNRALADLLIQAGAKADAAGPKGLTPLMVAAIYGNTPFATALLEAHADPTKRSEAGETALQQAAVAGQLPMVELLLAHGASLVATNKQQYSALDLSLLASERPVADFLVAQGARLDLNSPHRDEVLVALLRLDCGHLLEDAIHRGLNPDTRIEGWSLRAIAVLFQARSCVAALDQAGANARVPTPSLIRPAQLDQKMTVVHGMNPEDSRPTDEDYPSQQVVIQGVVDPAGRMLFPRVIDTCDPRLADAALAAVDQLRFSSPSARGKPASVAVTIPIVFPSSDERPLQTYELDSLPQPTRQYPPAYPARAHDQGESGRVVIDFVVDRQGVPRFVHVARTTDVVFDQSAVETVAGWRFRPGLSRGKPCDTEMEIPIVFQFGR